MTLTDIAHRRAVLSSASIRFTSETQPARETAIDKMIEQNLLLGDNEKGMTLHQIMKEGGIEIRKGYPSLSDKDIKNALSRLHTKGRVIVMPGSPLTKKRFKLEEKALEDLWSLQKDTERRFSLIVRKLFCGVSAIDDYEEPFLECLCIIFSRLGERYVRVIQGKLKSEDLLSMPSVSEAVQEVCKKYSSIDCELFKSKMFDFFSESDPDYGGLKWSMAQNYYVAKALGLDGSGYLLSKEMFGNSVFYLDTNVVIAALEPKSDYHKSFKAFSGACKNLNIDLRVCQITLFELERVITYFRNILPKVLDQIPPEIEDKVKGLFYDLYREKKAEEGTVDINALFSNFESPSQTLQREYDVQLTDDIWFDEEEHSKETSDLAKVIIDQSKRSRRLYPKTTKSALHDSLLLRWAFAKKKESGVKVSIATLDNLLPAIELNGDRSPAITLDALFQWISPLAMHSTGEGYDFETVFSDAVRQMLLPQERFFDLQDFLIFAELEYSCSELPSKDVEDCIRYIKTVAQSLNPTIPEDREKLSAIIRKFFLDPGRQYKAELSMREVQLTKAEETIKEKEADTESVQREYEKKIGQMEATLAKDREEKSKMQQDILKLNSQVEKLAGSIGQTQAQHHRDKKKVYWRATAVTFLVYESIAIYFVTIFGEGHNFLQRIVHSWELLAFGAPLALAVAGFIAGHNPLKKSVEAQD